MIRQERVVALDILRGLALFGMILVHFHQEMEIPATGREDLVGWIIWMGLETKAWATFAFLFGAGFAILMRRIAARGLNVVSVFLRRMLGLAVIGAAVQALTGFSILIEYAIWGIPLLLVRKWPTRALLVLAVASSVALRAYSTIVPYSRGPYYAAVKAADEKGTFHQAVEARARNMQWQYTQPRTLIPTSSFVLFLLGLLSIRHGIFDDPRRHLGVIVAAMAFGFASWAVTWFILPKVGIEEGFFGIISDQWLAFVYIGAVILLLAYRPVWQKPLQFFGTPGRMALTSYVLQATIISWLTFGYGLGLKMRPYYELPAAIALFSLIYVFSRIWLARFTYGPLERVWRSFTYMTW